VSANSINVLEECIQDLGSYCKLPVSMHSISVSLTSEEKFNFKTQVYDSNANLGHPPCVFIPGELSAGGANAVEAGII